MWPSKMASPRSCSFLSVTPGSYFVCHILSVLFLLVTQHALANPVSISGTISSQETMNFTKIPFTTTTHSISVTTLSPTSKGDTRASVEPETTTSTNTTDEIMISSANKITEECTCGVSTLDPEEDDHITTRVVGGFVATPHSHPWQVLLRYYQVPVCSATIISDLYILTAAHCIFMMKDFQRKIEEKYKEKVLNANGSVDFGQVSVALGVHNTVNLTDTEVVGVESFLVHPQHRVDEVHDTHDLALLRLSHRINYVAHIQPVCLPTQGTNRDYIM
ncbi:transmembrane protease serine 13-like isoform X1 [Homalodisca vitripennis]|uniref:transmembrane protease serine 13-like isoform X1 n=1 Tax=Homalodisca vitripennis TaxID=197043 RepID=UPI001EEA8B03|nr:transmembrane protease serine 13-like isoform X1 [Homalodisca vitripennis]